MRSDVREGGRTSSDRICWFGRFRRGLLRFGAFSRRKERKAGLHVRRRQERGWPSDGWTHHRRGQRRDPRLAARFDRSLPKSDPGDARRGAGNPPHAWSSCPRPRKEQNRGPGRAAGSLPSRGIAAHSLAPARAPYSPAAEDLHSHWDEEAERERFDRTPFAQLAFEPADVRQELEAADGFPGDADAVRDFVLEAAQRLGISIEVEFFLQKKEKNMSDQTFFMTIHLWWRLFWRTNIYTFILGYIFCFLNSLLFTKVLEEKAIIIICLITSVLIFFIISVWFIKNKFLRKPILVNINVFFSLI